MERGRLRLTSLNATSAFSILQETLFLLNSAMIVIESSLIPNFECDSWNRRGSELPIVAFLAMVLFSTSEVTQLLSPAMVH